MKFFSLICTLILLPLLLPGPEPTALPASAPAEERDIRYVALTFDDGPRADTTAALLDGLRQRGAKATFFVVGEQIPGNEGLLRRMRDEGHQVGNHTYSHVRLLTAADAVIIEELHKTEVLLTEALGPGDYWLRPPYGMVDRSRADLIRTPMIHWSLDTEDWKLLDTDKVTAAALEQVQPGDIILLHDFYPTSVEAALQIIDTLQPEGYAFVTAAELFDVYGTVPQEGEIYTRADRIRGW